MDDLVAAGVAGIMVSAVDPKTSSDSLNRIGGQVALFTTDSDAPNTQPHRLYRLEQHRCRQAGRPADDEGAAERRQVHGLRRAASAPTTPRSASRASRTPSRARRSTLVDVRGDDIDQTRAKRNVEDTLTANPDINCMIGFYSYNTPRIYEALKDAGKLGQIKIIGFDEDPITLGGVKEGTIVGTVVQQPYEWGYQGMKDMAKYLEGDKSVVPANKLMIIPTKIIEANNVDAFWAELKERQGKK